MLAGCGSSAQNTVDKAETVDNEDETLSSLWTDFYENMPQDRNVEDDFRNSQFMEELKKYLSDDEAFDITGPELSEICGINDVFIMEKTSGEWKARVIYVGADLYNKSVTDVNVRNKYVFLQMTDGKQRYFTTISDGDFVYPQSLLLFEYEGEPSAVIISKYCAAYPDGILMEAYTIGDSSDSSIDGGHAEGSSIVMADMFGEYVVEGVSAEKMAAGVLFESSYEAGTSFGDILKLDAYMDEETNDIYLISGENTITFKFYDGKYIIDGSGAK